MRRRIAPLLLACVLIAPPAVAQVDRLPDGAVLVDADTAALSIDANAAAIDAALAAGGDAAVLAARIVDTADPLQREATAARVIDRLQARRVDVPDALLDTLAAMPVLVWRRHDETAADWFLPVFDVPGRVASLRRVHAADMATQRLLGALARTTGADAMATLSSADPQVAAMAVRNAPEATVRRIVAQSTANKATAPLPSPVLAALAARAGDAATFLQALDAAAPLDVLPLFGTTLPTLDPVAARAVLAHALTLDAYASVAGFSLVALATRDPASQPLLRGALASLASGDAVAAALAQQPDALARIDALLADTQQPAALTHLALALRLQGSAAAQRRLATLVRDPRLPAAVARELQQ